MPRRRGGDWPAAVAAVAGVLALCACGPLSGLDPFGAPPLPPSAEAVRADAVAAPGPAAAAAAGAGEVVPDGRYAGLAILTAFHGDCNAGGTGEIVVHGRAVTYRDARNPLLSGRLGEHGEVDIAAGRTRLTGHFADAVFTGRIAGGACEYQMRYEHTPS